MKWLVGVLVMCATVSAQGIVVPAGFTKRAGGDAYKAIAKSAKVAVYANGDVELTTILLAFEPTAKTTAAIEQFDRELVTRTTEGNHVNDTRSFNFDQMLAEAFDQTATDRIYHRKLYAVDAKGRAHLWWTVCKGPAVKIGGCEEAQRTMKLEVVNTLPVVAAPVAPSPVPPPEVGTPQQEAGQPWSFVLPPGFVLIPGAGEAQVAKGHTHAGVRSIELRAYKAHEPKAALVVIIAVIDGDDDISWARLEEVDQQEAGPGRDQSTVHREHVGNTLVTEADGKTKKGVHDEQRALYGADPEGNIHMFALQCFGTVDDLAPCRSAMRSMRLELPDVVTPVEHTQAYRIGQIIGAILMILVLASIPIGALVWIVRRDRRDRKRRQDAKV